MGKLKAVARQITKRTVFSYTDRSSNPEYKNF